VNTSSKPLPSIWQRLPSLATYPLRPDVLGQIGLYSVARLATYLLGSALTIQWLPSFVISGDVAAVSRSLVGVLLELILLLLSLKLAVEALLNTAKDRLDPGMVGPEWATDNSAGKQILLLLFVLGPTYLLTLWLGTGSGWLALCVALLILPAAIIVLAMDESLRRALNPTAWVTLVERVGIDYFGVVALLGLLSALVVALQLLIFSRLGWPGAVISRFISLYALVFGYHVLGYLLFQHHANLGIDLTPPIVRPKLANLMEDSIMQQSDALAAAGEMDAAAAVLQDLIHRHGASGPIHQRYRQLLLAKNDAVRLDQHDREYVAVLLALGQVKQASALYVEAKKMDPAFQLEVPEDITKLIMHAAETGQSKLAVEMFEGFDTRFPRNADGAQNTLLVAKLMFERLGREAEAKRLLEGLLAKYPEHPLAPEFTLALVEAKRILGGQSQPRGQT
jgi:tetratricopeptide (TPR) repeat protein